LWDGTIRDYAELARLGGVTRARMTQITKLLDLAPDIQEQILFLPLVKGLNERNLRRIVSRIDWDANDSRLCGTGPPRGNVWLTTDSGAREIYILDII
jgi:hypothetical protein